MGWEWIANNAQALGPVVLILLGAIGILWRKHVQDQSTIVEITKTQGEAMTATAVAMEKLSSAIRGGNRGRG